MSRPKHCPVCGLPRMLDAFAGEGGAGEGYMRAGFCCTAVDTSAERLKLYPQRCPGSGAIRGDAIEFILKHGHGFAAGHGSPTCTGYSRGTAAIPDRFDRYDRLIPAVRDAFETVGIPYVIENVADARPELIDPIMLCGRMFNLTATDDDGTALTLDRHRLFESNLPLWQPEHAPHGWKSNRRDGVQVAGSYGGARRDKREAREVRKGGYVPKSLDVQRELLGTPWMTEKGCQLSIPPAYSEFIGAQLLDHLRAVAA
jgi:DNA (cytosine-5)-methyltransferase 1